MGAGKPLAWKEYAYPTPACAVLGGVDVLKPVGATGLTVIVTGWLVEEPLALLACTVKVNVPVAVGVPESTPVVGFSVKPAGKLPLPTV